MTTDGAAGQVRSIARSGSLNVIGAGLAAVAGFGVTLALTNGLTQGAAGTVFATTSAFLVLTAIVQLGTESGMARWLPVKLATDRVGELTHVLRAGLVPTVVVSCLAAVAVAFFAPQIAALLVGDRYAATVTAQVRILAAFLPLAATLNVVLASTRGLRTIRPTVLVESIGRSVLQFAAVLGVVLLGGSAPVVVAAWAGPYLLALVTAATWLLFLLRRHRSAQVQRTEDPPPERRGSIAREFWAYTGPRAVATVAQTVLKRSDIILVAALRSPSEAAVYAAASRFVTLGQVGVQALQQALGPQLSELFARGQRDQAQAVYQVTTTWAVMMAWPVYIACAVLAPVVLLLFGDGYTDGAPVVVILSAAMLLAVASGSVDTVVLMSGRSWLSLANTLAALVTNVGLNLLLIPPFGIEGAAVAWSAAIIVRNVLPLIQVRRYLGMSPFGQGTRLVASSAVVCVGVLPGVLALLGADMSWIALALALGVVAHAAVLYRARRVLNLAALASSLSRRRRGRPPGPEVTSPDPS